MKELFGENFKEAREIHSTEKKEEVKYIDEKEDINTREKWLYLLQNMEKRECVVCIDYTF